MSAPFSESDDDKKKKKKDDEAHAGSDEHGHKHMLGAGGPPTFTPKKTPRHVAGSTLTKDLTADLSGDLARDRAEPQSETAEMPDPPWKGMKRPGQFAGEADVMGLRIQLGREPERIPVPPSWSSGSTWRSTGQIIAVIAVIAAAGAFGYQWGKPPAPSVAELPTSATTSRNLRDARSDDAPALQLLVSADNVWLAEQPARLAISAPGAGANVTIIVIGLAPGTIVSPGVPAGPNTWRLPTAAPQEIAITPPRGFVGNMKLELELRLADGTFLDRKDLQLQWLDKPVVSAEPARRRLDPSEIAMLVKSGTELMSSGDIAAARLTFRRAAEAGDAPAAFALAETYDPAVLEKLGTRGAIKADVALAQRWYAQAKDLGSTAAPERLVRLSRKPE